MLVSVSNGNIKPTLLQWGSFVPVRSGLVSVSNGNIKPTLLRWGSFVPVRSTDLRGQYKVPVTETELMSEIRQLHSNRLSLQAEQTSCEAKLKVCEEERAVLKVKVATLQSVIGNLITREGLLMQGLHNILVGAAKGVGKHFKTQANIEKQVAALTEQVVLLQNRTKIYQHFGDIVRVVQNEVANEMRLIGSMGQRGKPRNWIELAKELAIQRHLYFDTHGTLDGLWGEPFGLHAAVARILKPLQITPPQLMLSEGFTMNRNSEFHMSQLHGLLIQEKMERMKEYMELLNKQDFLTKDEVQMLQMFATAFCGLKHIPK